MNIRRKLRAHTEIHTGPLNDILFILLLFFLIAATLANPNVIKLSQPKSQSDTKAKQTVVVSIAPDKNNPNIYNYFVGTNRVQGDSAIIELLRPALEKEAPENRTVVINADKTVPIDYVVAVMRVARSMDAKAVLAVDKNAQ
ncbi:MAG TPA: biopolymer transporter ExbD [Flavisolibacter sp.]|jgi:biopolymer transport protein ExbD|nr:biopolymer transporter ExbD [Flavisolibacter sp.]HZI01969.1 biopolymer transporter ExbD [Flavisolibacter sp.]